jgi:hypothetical protein
MRDYTYFGGGRFLISNIYRSHRFDIDRLDLNWVDEERPEFVRGFRVVDHQEIKTVTIHGGDADDLIFSMSYISSTVKKASFSDFDAYLIQGIEDGVYLITSHAKNTKEAQIEEVLH